MHYVCINRKRGEEMHKFNPENRKKLDSVERRRILPANQILEDFFLKSEDIMADIGCGIGYFTFPASSIINKEGKVYALDISESMLQEVENRINEEKIHNIITVKTEEYDLKLPDQSITYAFMCTVLHEISDKERFISEVGRILRKGGKMIVVDWEKKETDMGPPLSHRFGREEVKVLLQFQGLKTINEKNISDMFYGIEATK